MLELLQKSFDTNRVAIYRCFPLLQQIFLVAHTNLNFTILSRCNIELFIRKGKGQTTSPNSLKGSDVNGSHLLESVSQEKKGRRPKCCRSALTPNGSIEGRVPVDPLIPLAVGAMRYQHNEQTAPTKDYQSRHHDDDMLKTMVANSLDHPDDQQWK